MGALIPPSIAGTAGLANIMANGGWQILTDRPSNMAHQNPLTLAQIRSGSVNCFTVRLRQTALFAASHIVLVLSNCSTDNSLMETPGRNRIRFKAALQKNGPGGVTDESGARVAVTFAGQLFGECAPDGLLISDPVPFDVVAGEVFFVRYAPYVAGPSYYINALGGTMGGTNAGALNNGDGLVAGDAVMAGTTGGTFNSNTNCLNGVLGFSSTPQRTVALIGDSICLGTGDGGVMTQWGGYLVRLMRNQTAFVTTSSNIGSVTSNFPFVHMARGMLTAAAFALRNQSYKELKLAEFATTVVWEYGINDVGAGTALTAMQTNLLAVAQWFIARGKKFIACTLTPQTTSTDQFRTAANQTPGVNDSIRTGYNSWLRDASAAGFIAQAGGLSVADVLDVAAAVEVNPANVSTLNGGRWPSAFSTSDFSGSITSGAATNGFADSSQNAAQDAYRGYCLRMTSGAASGQVVIINNQSATGVYGFATNLSTTPSVGDSYVIYRPYTADGTHPSTYGHMTIANRLNTAANLAKVV